MTDPFRNPVGFLQEFCQKYNAAAFPKYLELGGSGPDHCKEFSCQCFFDGEQVIAKSRQKKQAKFEAAIAMLKMLQEKNYFDKFGVNLTDGESTTRLTNGTLPETNKGVVLVNPISALQEYCQGRRLPLPNYFESSTGGGFVCECSVGSNKAFGHGSSKKTAKTESAAKLCIELRIEFAGDKCFNDSPKETEEYCSPSDKNAVSVLKEFCDRKKPGTVPVYEDKGITMGLFTIECSVGTLKGEGRDITKKGAKILAANSVLGKMIQREGTSFVDDRFTNERSTAVKLDDNIQKLTSHQESKSVLEEFDLGSDEEEEYVKAGAGETLENGSLGVSRALQSLTLDDSVVEVEPTAVTVKKEYHASLEESSETENVPVEETNDGHTHKLKTPTSETILKWSQKEQTTDNEL